MLKFNLKQVLRYFWKKRIYSMIIVLSLVVGFTCTNLLISFFVHEYSTDSQSWRGARTFQIISNDPFKDGEKIGYITKQTAEYIKDNYAEVKDISSIAFVPKPSIRVKATSFSELSVIAADSNFFSIFRYPLMNKSGDNVLNPYSIVLTSEKASLVFGTTDVIGKELLLQTEDTVRQFLVSGVLAKPTENSHLVFDAIILNQPMSKGRPGGAAYVRVEDDVDVNQFRAKLNADSKRPGLIGPGKSTYFFEPLQQSYFSSVNRMPYMKTRSPMFLNVGYVVCAMILILASFNFINLFLLAWQDRKKEVGIKKVLGVGRSQLFLFTMVEVGLYVSLAFVLSTACTFWLFPTFNAVVHSNLELIDFMNPRVAGFMFMIVLGVGLLVLFISVWKQWQMKPVRLMKGGSSKIIFSRALFTLQFSVAVILLICSITIIKQMHYLETAPLGFNRNIIQLEIPPKSGNRSEALKQEILQIPGIEHASLFSGNPISGNMQVRYDLNDTTFYTCYLFNGDASLIKTLSLNIKDGRVPSNPSERLVNEKLVHYFNITNPIGELIPGTKDKFISGVVMDFTCGSFKQEIPLVSISIDDQTDNLLIDYSGQDLATLTPQLKTSWKNIYPDSNFSFKTIQDELMLKYREETSFFKIIITCAVACIILSAFGLFALSWAVIQSRTKEIGVRKVLGASISSILKLLSASFIKRIVLAIVIGSPVGYYAMQYWLERFVNRIDVSIGILMLATLLIMLVALATLSAQTIKAALTNPVDEIKNE